MPLEDLELTRRVQEFLALPAGGSQTMSRQEWEALALSLGEQAVPYFLESFRNGSRWEAEQAVSLFALRVHGWKAEYLEDKEGVRAYRVMAPGTVEWVVIHPKLQPYRMNDPDIYDYMYTNRMDEYEELFKKKEKECIAKRQSAT